jgi:hypothetical protein
VTFTLPKFQAPDFSDAVLSQAPDLVLAPAPMDGVPPEGFHLTTSFPEYYKINGQWKLPDQSIPYCCVVYKDDAFTFLECAKLQKDDPVVVAETFDGSEGVYAHRHAFSGTADDARALPYEESGSNKYGQLVDLMKYQKEHGGHIVWVMGPAVVFNYDTRIALEALAKAGYVNAVLAGNALATHDLEGGYLNTALGQNIYTQEAAPNGHYNHLDTINTCRRYGSIPAFIDSGEVDDGVIKVLVEEGIPFHLAGSIRDDGPLPPVTGNVSRSIADMTEELQKATLVINLATLLHGAASAGMVSGYTKRGDEIWPVYVYTIDITAYAKDSTAKIRWDFLTRSFETNVQDFVFTLKKLLIGSQKEIRR